MFDADVVHVKAAVGTTLFEASNPCAWTVRRSPSATSGVAPVMTTRVTVDGTLTVSVASANVPFDVAVALIVAVPAAVGVTLTVAPVVVLSGAIVALVVVQVNATPAIAVFDESNASATNCCVCPVRSVWLAGVTVTLATVGAGFTVIVALAENDPLLTVIVGDPTPAAVTVTAAPVVADRLAWPAFEVPHVSGADGMALLLPSNACAVRFVV